MVWKTRRKWKYFYAYLGKKGSTIHSKYFCILKLLTHIVMLKMINIYPLFIALSVFQKKHFRNYFDKCCLTMQHWYFIAFCSSIALHFYNITQLLFCFVWVCFFFAVQGLSSLWLDGRCSSTGSWMLQRMKFKMSFWYYVVFYFSIHAFYFLKCSIKILWTKSSLELYVKGPILISLTCRLSQIFM